MANPQLVACTIGDITPIMTNVTGGAVKIVDRNNLDYSESYRMTGEAAPTDVREFSAFNDALEPRSSLPIDVYILVESQTRTGTIYVRVDS